MSKQQSPVRVLELPICLGCYLLLFIALLQPTSAWAKLKSPNTEVINSPVLIADFSNNQILLLGLIINEKVVLESIRVRGKEDGEKPVDFNNWLLPLVDLQKPLKLQIFDLPSGGIEVATPAKKERYRLLNFITDPQLGTLVSIADLQAITGNMITFDINKYALVIKLPRERQDFRNSENSNSALSNEGLSTVVNQRFAISAIEQKINVLSGEGLKTSIDGEFRAIGSFYDTSWYLRANQLMLDRPETWNITDASIIRQQLQTDLVAGSQVPFWRRRSNGSYWGLTYINRQGFVPPSQNFGGDFLVADRLQSRRLGRSISGQATVGSIVRLVKGIGLEPLDEVLVDGSGIFRFDNVVIAGSPQEFFGQDYQLLIYPKGDLSSNPEVRKPQLFSTPGQLPKGGSAWVFSGGGNRVSNGTFGDFTAYQGGLLYRQGVGESVTIGAGAAYDQGFFGIGEIFWQPDNIPLEVALSGTAGNASDYFGRGTYRPSANFYLNASIDNLSRRVDTRWNLNNNFSLTSNYDSLRGMSGGFEYISSSAGSNTFIRSTIDSQARVKISASQRLDRVQANLQTNETNIVGQLAYQLTHAPNSDTGHRLVANYQASQQSINSTTKSSLNWQYRSPNRTSDGSYTWQSEIGYTWSNFGSGIAVGMDVALMRGLRLRANYRGVGEGTNQSDFSVAVVTTWQIDGGIRGIDNRLDSLRNLGRVELIAFLDNNSNGIQDAGEPSYSDPLLFKINQFNLNSFGNQTADNAGKVNLPPGNYRLDIDPAGYPPNYQATTESQLISVVASDIIRLSIPLIPSYTITGILKDQNNRPVSDTRIEIISTDQKTRADSVTNGAGVFYLQGLSRGVYQFKVSNFTVSPVNINIDNQTKTSQEIEVQVTMPSPALQP